MVIAFLFALWGVGWAQDWQALMTEAATLQTSGAYAEAERKFQDALSQAESFGSSDPRLALTLNNLGTLFRHEGKYQLAESHFQLALEIWSNDARATIALNNLAVLLVEQGRYSEAEAKYRRAISIAASEPALAPMLANLGTLCLYQGRYAEAETLYRRSLAIQEKAGS